MPTEAINRSEHAFQQAVVRLAKQSGWLVNHVFRGRTAKGEWRTNTTAKGYPDLTLLRPGRLVVLELKKPGGTATPEQMQWIALFQTVPGCEAYVVQPADWPEIVALLTEDPDPGT